MVWLLAWFRPDLFEEVIEDKTCDFKKGDFLTLYTDGVTEFQNQTDEEFGLEQVYANC